MRLPRSSALAVVVCAASLTLVACSKSQQDAQVVQQGSPDTAAARERLRRLDPDEIDDAKLRSAASDTANWLTYGRTYDEQRFSPLTQINDSTVSKLGLVWSRELETTRGLEATPLAYNGILYTTEPWSIVHALDARTGTELWTYDPQVSKQRGHIACCDVVNRGAAIYKGKVYVGTIDGRLVALNARTGAPVWSTATFDPSQPYVITGAPRIANGMVLIGSSGAEYDVRGYVAAYDAETGKPVWKTYTVPGDPAKGFESKALERAAVTWHGKYWEGGGGGTVWDAIVYDPSLELVYIGTANGHPWYRDIRGGSADNLYISSIIALRVRDGSQVWHFQTAPGDHWDFDANQPLLLADLPIGGGTRKVITQANKNAFFYVLDRQTGEFLSGTPFAYQDWATGLDPKSGRPIETKTAYDRMNAVMVSPSPGGAHNWYPMSFSPKTGLVYIPMRDHTTQLHTPDPEWKPNPKRINIGIDARYKGPLPINMKATAPASGHLVAWDPVAQRAKWTADFPVLESGGTLATAGNLVFQGRADGVVAAYRATDGRKLWEFDAGTGIMAPPITYAAGGVQYVTLMVGFGGVAGLLNPPDQGPAKFGFGRILTFALGGKGTFTPRPFGHTGRPTPAMSVNVTKATLAEGGALYATHCIGCHGINAVAGSLPDLRYTSADVHKMFEQIVLGGTRQERGMPSYGDVLTPVQARAIQAYVLARAAESK